MISQNYYKFFLLADRDELDFSPKTHFDKYLHEYANTYQIKNVFLELDNNFSVLQNLKQKYLRFNSTHSETKDEVSERLNELISLYYKSNLDIFIEFAGLLNTHQDQIIASFEWVQLATPRLREKNDYIARLSNGPMESFNRVPKDTKSISRGYLNFDFARSRMILSSRKNTPIRTIPKTDAEIHSYRGKTRG